MSINNEYWRGEFSFFPGVMGTSHEAILLWKAYFFVLLNTLPFSK